MDTTVRIKGAMVHEGESLCKTCRWVHMQKGFRESEEGIFCDYGELRPVRFKVAECTDYLDGHHTQPLGHGENRAPRQSRTSARQGWIQQWSQPQLR